VIFLGWIHWAQFVLFRRKFLDASIQNNIAICKYTETSLIWTANYPEAGYPDRQLSGSTWPLGWSCRELYKTNLPWNYRLSDQVQYSVMASRISNQARSKSWNAVCTVNCNCRTSNCQCGLFSKKNPIIRIFYISGRLTVPINPNKWISTVRKHVSSNRFYSVQSKTSQRTLSEQKPDEIGTRWRRFQDNHWLNVHSK